MDGGRRRSEEVVSTTGFYAQASTRRVSPWAVRGGLFFAALVLGACVSTPSSDSAGEPRDLVVGFPEGNVSGADLGPNQFTSMLSLEGLTWGNVDGRSTPRLAESWQWEKGGLQLRLRLREGVTFHDGTPLSATVATDILRNAISRPNARSSYSSLSDITAVRAEGDLDVVLELSQPSAFLPDDLDMPLSLRPGIGAGPFRVVKRDAAEVVLERFEQYYQGTPSINRIQVRTFDALRTAWSSLLRGEVDMVTDVPAEAVEFIQSSQAEVIRYKRRYQFMVAFNSRRRPFDSPKVRRALNLAVNRDALIDGALRGYGSPATGPLWPKHWAYDASIPAFTFDPGDATALLDDAGLVPGTARASHVPQARLKFTCLIADDFSLHERLGLELQKQLYDVGIDMQFEVVDAQEFNTRVQAGNFESILIDSISGPSFGRPYIFWRSAAQFDGSWNKFGYESAEAERLFQLLRWSALNEAATRSATHRLQRVFMEDPPALFIAWSERARVVGPKFRPVIDPERDPVLTMWRWAPSSPTLTATR